MSFFIRFSISTFLDLVDLHLKSLEITIY